MPLTFRTRRDRTLVAQRRDEAIVLRFTTYNGHHLIDLRTWFTDADGKLKPSKGFSANVKDLSKLAAALAKALERARELGVVEGNESPTSDRHAGEAEPTGRFIDLPGSWKPSGFECAGLSYVATISRFPDGSIGEVKCDSHADTAGGRAARSASPSTSRRHRGGQRMSVGTNDDAPEMSPAISAGIASHRRIMISRQPTISAEWILRQAAIELFRALEVERFVHPGLYDTGFQAVVDELEDMGKFGGIATDKAQEIITDAKREVGAPKPNGTGHPIGAGPQTQTREWPDPCPLPDALLPIAPFKLDLLPEKLRPWAEDIADRMQCPADYLGVSIMSVLGSVIGSKIVIRPKTQDDWQVVANQWALLIGRPGVLKSPAMEEVLKPLKRLSAEADRSFKDAKAPPARCGIDPDAVLAWSPCEPGR
jgi:hypothetical protein